MTFSTENTLVAKNVNVYLLKAFLSQKSRITLLHSFTFIDPPLIKRLRSE